MKLSSEILGLLTLIVLATAACAQQPVAQSTAAAVTAPWPIYLGQPARTTAALTSTTCPGSGCVAVATVGYGVATVTVNGTYAGATITFAFSDDGGTTYYAQTCTRVDIAKQENSEVLPSNQTRAWDCGVYAASNFEVSLSAISTGTANIGITMSAASIEPAATVATSGPNSMADGSGNALTSNSTTVTSKFALDVNFLSALGTVLSVNNGTSGAGDLRINLASDNTAIANWGQGATGSSVPAGATYQGARATTSLPTGVSAGQMVGAMADMGGRIIVRSGGPRERLVVNDTGSISATGSNTLVAAGASGVFRDLTMVQCSNAGATAVRVDISDGTKTYSWFLAASGGGFNLNFEPPLAATTAATAWTMAISASDTGGVYCGAQAVETN